MSAISKLPSFLRSQFLITPKYPQSDCTGRTIVVSGANTGLGKEAARHIVRLNADRVIITSRDAKKGVAAAADIEQTTGRKGVVEVWDLDLESYENVKAFAQRLNELPRLDAIIENAGKNTQTYSEVGGNESTITVNVVSTFLLALLVLPKLQETARKFNTTPTLTIVSSEVHFFTAFPERKSANIFETLNNPTTARMTDRYNVSKLLEVLVCRRIARNHPDLGIILNFVNPGFCKSELIREMDGAILKPAVGLFVAILARTTEVGSRTLVHAGTEAGKESYGQYLSDCKVQNCAKLVEGPGGKELEEKVWRELSEKLEAISPGVTKVLGPEI